MSKVRAVLYVRLSKEDADKAEKTDESESIRNQKQLLTDYALLNNYEIVNIYSDDDESGLYDDRPGFRQMMKDAEERLFDVIIAKNQARFSRSMEHIEKYLHSELPHIGIRFIGVVDGTDTKNARNKKARQINGLINEWYCEDLSENIKNVFRSKMEHGKYIGGTAPYGYIVDPSDHNHLIIDPYAADIVRKIFSLYLKGYGKAKIASVLTDEGIYIPTIYKREILGLNYRNAKLKNGFHAWSYQTVHNILKNEMYIGNMVQHRYKRISYKSKKKISLPEEQWIKKENTHEPIIEMNVWNAVQEQLKHRTSTIDFTPSGLLSGKVYCGNCGKPMCRCCRSGNNEKGCSKTNAFICSTYKKYGRGYCISNIIYVDDLEKQVLKSAKEEFDKIVIRVGSKKIKAYVSDLCPQNTVVKYRDTCEDQLKKIASYKTFAFEKFADGMISQNQYTDILNLYTHQEEKLKLQIRKRKEQLENKYKAYCKFEEWNDLIISGKYSIFSENEILRGMIEKIIINSSKDITIRYQFSNPDYFF